MGEPGRHRRDDLVAVQRRLVLDASLGEADEVVGGQVLVAASVEPGDVRSQQEQVAQQPMRHCGPAGIR
ncbi:hypothetical protein [Streptomyces caniscabiei]|uniref:hypothetical protein n=1 Tax=Streptomyces caniscabiei TaxID=2746961 RepID=UPI000765ED3B|nr:hypothetical protein [Streptomyces caniscabiei]